MGVSRELRPMCLHGLCRQLELGQLGADRLLDADFL